MKRKVIVAGAVTLAGALGVASPASAFYCTVANKPAGAGVVDEAKFKETRSGNFVAPGAFLAEDGVEFLIRGGDGHGAKGTGNESQFGAATENAINNGPSDHGIVEAEFSGGEE